MDNTVNQIPICRILPQERYRAGQGSSETRCTEHALPAGTPRQFQFDEQIKTAPGMGAVCSFLDKSIIPESIYSLHKHTMDSTWLHLGNRSAAMAFFSV